MTTATSLPFCHVCRTCRKLSCLTFSPLHHFVTFYSFFLLTFIIAIISVFRTKSTRIWMRSCVVLCNRQFKLRYYFLGDRELGCHEQRGAQAFVHQSCYGFLGEILHLSARFFHTRLQAKPSDHTVIYSHTSDFAGHGGILNRFASNLSRGNALNF